MCDDLMLGLLDLHEVPEFIWPIGFTLANDLAVRLKHTHQLVGVKIAIEHPRLRLPNYLF